MAALPGVAPVTFNAKESFAMEACPDPVSVEPPPDEFAHPEPTVPEAPQGQALPVPSPKQYGVPTLLEGAAGFKPAECKLPPTKAM